MTAALAPGLAITAAFAAGGLVFGWVYFAALRRAVELYAAGSGHLVPALLTLVRVAGAIAFLGFAARFGALALLGAFLGFLAARARAVGAARRTA